VTYTGPSYELRLPDEAGSLALGPAARLEGFAGSALKEETLTLGPGTRVPDLRRLAFERRVNAFKLVCAG
jgi:hypothetical protein